MLDDYIETYTGIKFDFLNPKVEQIDIEDIAHSLAVQVRFTGHCKEFYSIAEHSINVMDIVPPEHKLWALLHDAGEAYLTDVASPIKKYLTNYKQMEKKIMDVICDKFGLDHDMPPIVHEHDMQLLSVESHHLMTSQGLDWEVNKNIIKTIPNFKLECYNPNMAKEFFLEEFYKLI